ncbi:MAG: hypothetical protein JF616_01490 [Fibrobacteres bacterium]|nr:hypothetical protein [Fibrobacterota bacterium]
MILSTLAGCVSLTCATPEEFLLHPGFDLLSLRPKGFEPRVAGLAALPGDRLAVATWRPNEIWILSGYHGPLAGMKARKAMGGFHELMGLCALGDTLYAADQDSIYVLRDTDGDGLPDARKGVGALPWSGSFHEWSFGLVHTGGRFYTALSVAAKNSLATLDPQKDNRRGSLVSMDPAGKLEVVASGLRAPDGLCLGPDSGLFATDNQGTWLPANKFIHVQPGHGYGHHIRPAGAFDEGYPSPPAVWLPYGSFTKSPTQPAYLTEGPYAGQFLVGDIAYGAMRRIAIEKVNGQWQGCVMHFSGGFEAGEHRLLPGPGGTVVVGGLGNGDMADWGWNGKLMGLQMLKPNGKPVFEILTVHARKGGYEVVFTQPIDSAAATRKRFQAKQWWYEPTEAFGGPEKDVTRLNVASVNLSRDGSRLFLKIDGLLPQQVCHVHIEGLKSRAGLNLWTPDFWYTLNAPSETGWGP